MNDRQNLAEHGTALVVTGIAAMGLAVSAPIAASAAVVVAWGLDQIRRTNSQRCKSAVNRAARILKDGDYPNRGITAALQLLKERRHHISIDPRTLKDAETRHGFPDALYAAAFDGVGVPKDDRVEEALRHIIAEAYEELRQDDSFHKIFVQESVTAPERDVQSGFQRIEDLLADVKDDTAAIRGMTEELVAREESRAREFGIKEGMLIALARRYAEGNPEDFDAALRGLERALEVAANEKQRGVLPGNTDDAVNAVIARVDALNEDGAIDEAAALIAEEKDRAKAGLMRLCDKGIAQAILTRDVGAAVAYELEKLPLDTPDPAAQFEALRAIQDVWYKRGRDKGLNFDLEVANALARAALNRASNPDQRGTAGIDLGIALATLGEREAGTSRLEEAVTANRAALEEFTRDRVPLEWAMTQMNLGNALLSLGVREPGTDRLEEAVTAYRDALEERTRDRVPLQWARTHMNLGNALQTLGDREPGTDRLEEAVTAHRDALKEYTRDRAPLDWAMTQMNLGNALKALGDREPGNERLEEAVTAYRDALKERTRDRVPLDWAMTQLNLGNALQTLGTRDSSTERLEEAVNAYRAALEENTRDRVPLQWAGSTMAMTRAMGFIAERSDDVGLARSALTQANDARAVLVDGGHEV